MTEKTRAFRIDAFKLKGYLEHLSKERSPLSSRQGLEEAASFIEETLSGFGYEVDRDDFLFEGEPFFNLMAQKKRGALDSPLILGAHYDAVEGSPGADDNASGVAVLLEVARVLFLHPLSERIQFVAFTLEEWGMVGSSHYVAKLKKARVPLKGMISLEMVGFTSPTQSYPPGLSLFYPRVGNFIGVGTNWASRELLKSFVRGMRTVKDLPVETITLPGTGGLIPAIRLSDQSPFWDAGYPALLVTDTSFYRNPHYHLPSDTIETLDLSFLAKVAQAVLEGTVEAT